MSGSNNFTQTPNIALYKPTFNADVDAWGGHWNANADTLDNLLATTGGTGGTFLPLAGGTMTGPLTVGGTLGSTSRPGFLMFNNYLSDPFQRPWFTGGNWGFGWQPTTLTDGRIRTLDVHRDAAYTGSLVGANPGALQVVNNIGAAVTGLESNLIATVNTSATAGLATSGIFNINKKFPGSGAIVLNVVGDDQSARMSSVAGGNVVQENDLNGSGPDDAFIRIGMEATFKESPTGGPSPDGASTFFYGGIRCRGGAVNSAQTGFTNPPATATYAFGATTFAPGQGGLVGRFVTPFLADGCSGAAYSAASATQTLPTSAAFSGGVSAISLTNALPFPSYVWPGALVTGTGIQANTHVVTSSWNGSNTTTISLDKVTSGALTSGQTITFTNAIGTGFTAAGYLAGAGFDASGMVVGGSLNVAMRLGTENVLDVSSTTSNYLQYTTSGIPRLRYMAGGTEVWSISDTGVGTGAFIPLTQRATANGVATLDATGTVPTSQLPGTVTGTLNYRGAWDASTNTPVAASGARMGGIVQAAGNYWAVSVGATTAAIDGVTVWAAGDWISSNGTVWQKVQTSTGAYLPLVGGNVTGATTFASTLSVAGATTLANATVGGTLGVTGTSTHSGAATFSAAGTGVSVTNNATIGGTFGVTGNSTMTGSLIVGNAASTAILRLQGAVNQARTLQFTNANVMRWGVAVASNPPTEAGGNTGANFRIDAYSDAGTFVGNLLEGNRTSGPMNGGAPWINMAPYRQTVPMAARPNGITGNLITMPARTDTQPTFTLANNPLSVTSGSPTVTITWVGACVVNGVLSPGYDLWVLIGGATAVGGITPVGWFRVASIVDNDHFTITWTSNATSTATGGGAAVTIRPSFTTTVNWLQSGIGTSGSGFPNQDSQLLSIDPEFYSNSPTLYPRYQQSWKWVVGPNDTSGLYNWNVAAVEWDLTNRGLDHGYSPNLSGALNTTIGIWMGPKGGTPPAWSTGGGTGTHWNTVYAVFSDAYARVYDAFNVQPNALVGASEDPTGHGGVGTDIFGAYTPLGGAPFTTTSGTSTVRLNGGGNSFFTQVNGNTVWIPNVTTLAGVTFGGGSYTMSGITTNSCNITGTGTANASISGGGAGQWVAFANLVPFAPHQTWGSFKHGLISTNARFESGGIIETQPGNGILWNDGTATASVNGAAGTAGNIGVMITTAGTGAVIFGTLPVNAANDAGAATANVPVGGIYRNGSVLQVRVA